MVTLEIILIAIAISLDSFALMACKGAVKKKINISCLFAMSLLLGIWHSTVFVESNLIVGTINGTYLGFEPFAKILTLIIFLGLGTHMLCNAVNNKKITERREDKTSIKGILLIAVITSFDAVTAGIALAFLRIDLSNTFIPVMLVNMLSTFLGTYTGYYFGYEYRSAAYAVSAEILLISGINVLIKYII
jgi:putative Mn2+ efflux pump MntP